MNSFEIENRISEEEKREVELNKLHATVEIERLELAKEIATLQTKKKDLDIALIKSKQTLQEQRALIAKLKRDFWSAKNSGG